jgi:hypothetical protein
MATFLWKLQPPFAIDETHLPFSNSKPRSQSTQRQFPALPSEWRVANLTDNQLWRIQIKPNEKRITGADSNISSIAALLSSPPQPQFFFCSILHALILTIFAISLNNH